MSFKKDKRQEVIIYLVLWAMLFIAPVLSLAVRTSNTDIAFDWNEIFTVWKQYAVFFVVFLIHNHLMAPLLVYRQKKVWYLSLCLVIVVIFQVYQYNHRPNFRNRGPRAELRMKGERPSFKEERQDFRGERPDFDGERPPLPPDFEEGDFDGPPPMPDSVQIAKFEAHDDGPRRFRERRFMDERAPIIMGQHDIISLVILILMLGMNLGVKLYFKQRGDQKHLAELEKENLEQQLEYLKYQINPHFFMNTLNNIHALVDIDPEKAKTTILELSKMMRFVLYEGNKAGVPLDREIAFLQNYITLMKLRYTDKVKISVKTPDSLPNKEVPPLMFITFVENAFKHGVSYRQDSFIDIVMTASDHEIKFVCKNSKKPAEEDKHGGVGLTNVKQRLDLIYGKNYTLDLNDGADTYTVTLTLPL